MTALDVPAVTTTDALPRGRGDGVGRLARRTQRGQGGRRVLVVVLIALAVGLGVLASAWTATLAATDTENLLQDRFGVADIVIEDTTVAFTEPTVALTAEQQAWLDEFGRADALGDTASAADDDTVLAIALDEVVALLPDGAEVLRYRHDGLYGYGSLELLVTDLDVTSELGAGTFDTRGRTEPLVGGEALVSPSVLQRFAVTVGDTLTVPGVGEVEIVGTLTRAAARSSEVVVVAPGRGIERPGSVEAVRVALPEGVQQETLAIVRSSLDAAVAATQAEQPNAFVVAPELAVADEFLDGQEDPTSIATLVGTVVTGFAVTVAALVAACAFAVGIRRRLRELGMLGAVGAAPAQLSRLVRREGLWMGVLGAAAGAVLGIAVALAGQPLLERLVDRDVSVALPVAAVLPPVLLGALAAMLAAWSPARTAGRVPVVAALAGRVPTGRVPGWLPVVSVVTAAAGIALFAWVLASENAMGFWDQSLPLLGASIVATLGVAGLGLPVLALGGRLSDRLPVLPRLALRDAARRRARSGAAIAALVPVLALPVAGLVVATGDDAYVDDDGLDLRQPPPSTVAVVIGPFLDVGHAPPASADVDLLARELPTTGGRADVVSLGPSRGTPAVAYWSADGGPVPSDLSTQYVPGTEVALATPALLDVLGLAPDAVRDGEVLLLTRGTYDPPPVDGATLPVAAWGGQQQRIGALRAVVRDDLDAPGQTGALVTPATAAELGLVEVRSAVALDLDRPLAVDELRSLWQLTGERATVLTTPTPSFWETDSGRLLSAALAGLAALVVVCVVAGMTSALAATESDDDLRRAVALGAEPATRRRFHGVQAWWHAAVAGILGTGLGLTIGWVVVAESGFLAFDATVWPVAVAWALVAPVAVGLTIAAFVRSSPVEAPRRRMA